MGIIAVGFMAVPIMTTGAACDGCQTLNWKYGLHMSPSDGRRIYTLINGRSLNVLGWTTTVAVSTAAECLVGTWIW